MMSARIYWRERGRSQHDMLATAGRRSAEVQVRDLVGILWPVPGAVRLALLALAAVGSRYRGDADLAVTVVELG